MTALIGSLLSQDITVDDFFCGAGGSSQGAEAAGARVVHAANHDPLCIETHQTNFPNVRHDRADISQVEPRRFGIELNPDYARQAVERVAEGRCEGTGAPLDMDIPPPDGSLWESASA